MRLFFAFAALTMSVGCNAYDPNLGNNPFRCGDGDPRCPDGYTCVVYSPTMELCEREGGGSTDGGGNFACENDSSIEPNNELAFATPTPIPTQDTMVMFSSLAICPADDVDVYHFGIDLNGRNLRADISFDAGQSGLILEVWNSAGTTIRTGEPVSGNAGLVRAEVPNMPPGDYYVSITSATGLQNNYALDLEISGP